MSLTSIEIAFDLDEDCSPKFLDGKLRISIEDDVVSLHVNLKRNGCAYILAEAPLADFRQALGILGIVPRVSKVL